MKIQSINNTTNFKGIYQKTDYNYNKNQLDTIENIKTMLRSTDKNDYLERSFEDRFKEDQGRDFLILPTDSAISLIAVKGLRQEEAGIKKHYTYDKNSVLSIGSFDIEHPLEISDIPSTSKLKRITALDSIPVLFMAAVIPLMTILGIVLNTYKSKHASTNKIKPLIENVDTVLKQPKDLSILH